MAQKLTDPEFHEPFADLMPEPPRRRSIPSITELLLARDDRNREPSLRPGMHPVEEVLRKERDAREKDNF